jgi:hypothetical protein
MWILSLTKRSVSTGMPKREAAEAPFLPRPLTQWLLFLQVYCIQLSEVEALNIESLNFELCYLN